MKKILVLLLGLSLIGCATTMSRVSNRLSLGMTQQEVRRRCGQPFRKEAEAGQESWFYQEQVWVKTGYPALLITEVNFENGKVVQFRQGPEPKRQPNLIIEQR